MAQRLLDIVDPSLPDDQMMDWLQYYLWPDGGGSHSDIDLLPEEVVLIRKWSFEAGPKTRKVASSYLFWNGPCSWEDISQWATDADCDVRYGIVQDAMTFGNESFGGRECLVDKERFIKLVSSVAERYTDDHQAIFALRELAEKGDEWLELSWREANRLLALNDVNLNTALIVSYFEDVIPHFHWGPLDSHIMSWVYGKDSFRQCIFLKIATWVGIDNTLREIIQELTKSFDPEIVSLAKGVLDGRLGYADV